MPSREARSVTIRRGDAEHPGRPGLDPGAEALSAARKPTILVVEDDPALRSLYRTALALAGYMVAIRFIIFAILPSWGLSNAAATLVGQNLGAGKPDRAQRSVWLTGFYNMVFLVAIAVLFIVWAEPLIAFFAGKALPAEK